MHSTVKPLPRVICALASLVWSGPVFSLVDRVYGDPLKSGLDSHLALAHNTLPSHYTFNFYPDLYFFFHTPLLVLNDKWIPSIPHLPNHAHHLIYFQEFVSLVGAGTTGKVIAFQMFNRKQNESLLPMEVPAYVSVSKSPLVSSLTQSMYIENKIRSLSSGLYRVMGTGEYPW